MQRYVYLVLGRSSSSATNSDIVCVCICERTKSDDDVPSSVSRMWRATLYAPSASENILPVSYMSPVCDDDDEEDDDDDEGKMYGTFRT